MQKALHGAFVMYLFIDLDNDSLTFLDTDM